MAFPSYFDPTVTVDRNNWAITMICNSERSGKQVSSSGSNHAILAIEKVKKNGELYRQLLHLTGPSSTRAPNEVIFQGSYCYVGMLRVGEVKLSKRHLTEVSYTHKSETWVRSAEKVRIIKKQAKQEKNNPSQYPRAFSIFGNKSFFTKDLETFKITDPLIAAFANCDKKLFLWLYDRAQKCRDGIPPGIERLKDRYFNPLCDEYPYCYEGRGDGGYNIARREVWSVWDRGRTTENQGPIDWILGRENFCWRFHIRDKRFSEIAELFAKSESPQAREELIQNAPEKEKKFFIEIRDSLEERIKWHKDYVREYFEKAAKKISSQYPQLKERVKSLLSDCEKDAFSACNKMLMTIYEHSDLCRLKPDSCFTWAREKLALADIKMEDKSIECFVSPTRMYLEPVKKGGACCDYNE